MIEIKQGQIIDILKESKNTTEVLLDIDHDIKKAINYNYLTGKVSIGDRVFVNTTAGTLNLGTGGYHFVIINLSHNSIDMLPNGHGMKLRYTPFQVKVPYIEENLELQNIYNKPLNLKGKIICFAELHSMVEPLCSYLKFYSKQNLNISYIMTDYAALPIFFSKSINYLKDIHLIDNTITIGNAFGGDYECVNIYTALQTAFDLCNSDIVIIAMGPGITGTGSKYGFTGLDIGFYIDLANKHFGSCYYIPRLSFADKRTRHYGISHHTITILDEQVNSQVNCVFPSMPKSKFTKVFYQLKETNIIYKHSISFQNGKAIKKSMDFYKLKTTTMGRGISDDPYFFYSIGATGKKILSDIGNLYK